MSVDQARQAQAPKQEHNDKQRQAQEQEGVEWRAGGHRRGPARRGPYHAPVTLRR